MGNRLNCVGTDKGVVAQEQATEEVYQPNLPDLTLQLAQYEAKRKLMQYPDNDNGCNKFLTRELWNEYKNKKCDQGIAFKTCIMAGGASEDSGIGVYAGSPSAYRIFNKFFDPIIQEYHGHGPKDRHFTEMSAYGLENCEFSKIDAALVNSTIISVERNFEGFPIGPGVMKLHRIQIMDLVRQACKSFPAELQGTFYQLEGMSAEVYDQLTTEDFLFNDSNSISNFQDDDVWAVGRAIFHNNDKSLLIWINEKNHLRISSMCQGVDIKGSFERLIKATNHIQSVCKFAHDKHYGYFTPCPTNLGSALLASVLLNLPRLKKNREAFEAIVDQYQLKVSGFNEQEESPDGTAEATAQEESSDAQFLNQKEDDNILCISNKICLGRSERQLVQDLINCVHELLDAELDREKKAVPLDKASVQKLPLSLQSLREVLTRAFKDFDPDHMNDVIVALGNTGCGKSTLLSAMLMGSESLTQKDIIDMVQRKKGGKTEQVQVKRKVIDYRNQKSVLMPIGHSLEKSETFIPILIKSPLHDFSYVDIAGLQDTGGSIMEYVNQFINKKIFSMASKIRFIVPFTRDQIYDARGVQVAEQVTILLNIFHGDLATMSKSVQPVVTKVKVNDDEFDLDHCRETLGRILDVCLENFMAEFELTQEIIQEIENLKARDGSNTTDIQTPPVSTPPNFQNEGNDRCLTDKFVIYQKYKDLEAFFNDFRDRLVLVDPIDREIKGASDENQATSVSNFVNTVSKLPPLKGSDLFVPLSDEKYQKIIDMFQRENMKVADEGARFLDFVKSQKKFDLDFTQNQAVGQLTDLIKFFMDNQLIEDIEHEMEKLNNFVSSIIQQVGHEKLRAEVGDVGKFLLDNVKYIIQRRKEKNYNSMVKKMIDVVVRLQNLGDISMDEAQKKKLEDTRTKANYFFKKLMDDMMRRPQELFVFAYELRMQDTFDSPPDYFTNYFFYFIKNDIDPIITKLVLANKSVDGKMIINEEVCFKLLTGPDFKHVFKYNANDAHAQPFAIKDPSTVNAEELSRERKTMGFFAKAFNNVQKNLLKKYGESDHEVQFLLHQQGLIIQRGDQRLMTKRVVQDNGAVQVVWGDETNTCYYDTKMVVWTFRQCKSVKNSYYIEQLYGERKPRMMCNKEDPQLWSNLQCSRTKTKGYEECAWQIMAIEEGKEEAQQQTVQKGKKKKPISPVKQRD